MTIDQLQAFTSEPVGSLYTNTGVDGFYLFRAREMIVPRKPGKPDPLGPKAAIPIKTITKDEAKTLAWIESVWAKAER